MEGYLKSFVVPTPVGVGMVLGLVTRRLCGYQAEPGRRYEVEQISGDTAFFSSFQTLCQLAASRGLPHPAKLAPWRYFLPGPCGSVQVSDCQQEITRDPGCKVWILTLINPRPAWISLKASLSGQAPPPRAAAQAGLFPEMP
jgi:hypothetical protein